MRENKQISEPLITDRNVVMQHVTV
uniref:Uncharacterized protein n=1 Tax=Arundo donax TaxID=35708 RepID=A0A0A9AZR9_ARUDO